MRYTMYMRTVKNTQQDRTLTNEFEDPPPLVGLDFLLVTNEQTSGFELW
jgi:hypothetical protein